MNRRFIVVLALCVLFVSACNVPNHNDAIVFVTNTQVGLKVGSDAYQKPAIEIGYHRQEGAIVPLYIQRPKNYSNKNDYLVRGLLLQVSSRLDKNTAQEDKLAKGLIEKVKSIKGSHSAEHDSPVLDVIYNELNALNGMADPQKMDQRMMIKDLIVIEIEKNNLLYDYNKDAKYMAVSTTQEKMDAYSVFGTFSGDSGATTDSTFGSSAGADASAPNGNANASFKGSVAQSFATGVAAQIWAAQGAGVAGGTPNEINISSDFSALAKKGADQIQQRNDIIDDIVALVFPSGTKDADKATEYINILDPEAKNKELYDSIFSTAENLKRELQRRDFSVEVLKEHYSKLKGEN